MATNKQSGTFERPPDSLATRLTCFAIVYAVETDLRSFIADVALENKLSVFLPDDVRTNAAKRMALDEGPGSSDDFSRLEYIDFSDLAKLISSVWPAINDVQRELFSFVREKLIECAPARNRVCHGRCLEPEDLPALIDLADQILATGRADLFTGLANVREKLRTQPAFVFELEIPRFWAKERSTVLNNLPVPDFDDTGFIGRTNDRRNVAGLLRGRYPVISIIGQGGVGKTALALRCLYDIVDTPESCPFELVAWASLKTKRLTLSGITEVRDSITTSLNLFQRIATNIGVPRTASETATKSDLLAEIQTYLREFRILLVIDNCEAVDPTELVDFLIQLPEGGSKVLMTSRVGLGQIEVPFPLASLDPQSAVRLMRTYASRLNLEILSREDAAVLQNYCSRLQMNPLAIKWFVENIAAGATPDSTLSRSNSQLADVLRFCFENVFNGLKQHEVAPLKALYVAGRPLSFVEICAICDGSEPRALRLALARLINASIVRRDVSSAADTAGGDHVYSVNEFATTYLTRCISLSTASREEVEQRIRRVRAQIEGASSEGEAARYVPWLIHVRKPSEALIGAKLGQILGQSRTLRMPAEADDLEPLLRELEPLEDVLPSFFEIARVKAHLLALAHRLPEARQAYEEALELAPEAHVTLLAYARFLLADCEEFTAALPLTEKLVTIDPESFEACNVHADALMLNKRYAEASVLYTRLLNGELKDRTLSNRLHVANRAAECHRRWCEQHRNQRNQAAAVAALSAALSTISEAITSDSNDRKNVSTLERILAELRNVVVTFGPDVLQPQFAKLIQDAVEAAPRVLKVFGWTRLLDELVSNPEIAQQFASLPIVEAEARRGRSADITTDATWQSGQIDSLRDGYGFLETGDGTRLFFPYIAIKSPLTESKLSLGMAVRFQLGRNHQGPCATAIAAW